MPKPTFFNLPPEKREAIEAQAIREFGENTFERASLSKIVENCGIAKGSMYQYFEDKLDLYLYIVELAYAEKRRYVERAYAVPGDIFQVLEAYYRESLRFALEHPALHKVANKFWESRGQHLDKTIDQVRASRASDFRAFLQDAMESGVVNGELDPEAVFFVYHAVGKALIDQFGEKVDSTFLCCVLDVLKYGLRARKGEPL
ncbi:MAG TPA: TetR/AcrR family transcriptional regulator [Firmicutes bacterium]|nr:TetR/AcrR family transcriptional regulator [Bacillota bacterium]